MQWKVSMVRANARTYLLRYKAGSRRRLREWWVWFWGVMRQKLLCKFYVCKDYVMFAVLMSASMSSWWLIALVGYTLSSSMLACCADFLWW